ncbi:hypothetical protein HY68_35745 [Streptomyces sp. AcH 505]|uniref:hypothetical protein n=1 Tax=Streptomyces sp. AcH 505 TaxID=352211 RepID=UPI0005918E2D|nr:hypothetical protein HY68_35745 [Streptomyces sp. AcH 505]
MTAQPDHEADRPGFTPPMRTFAELREALSRWGSDGDRQKFDDELGATDINDHAKVSEITQAYRHRVLLRLDPAALAELARPTTDVEAELRRKLEEAGAR